MIGKSAHGRYGVRLVAARKTGSRPYIGRGDERVRAFEVEMPRGRVQRFSSEADQNDRTHGAFTKIRAAFEKLIQFVSVCTVKRRQMICESVWSGKIQSFGKPLLENATLEAPLRADLWPAASFGIPNDKLYIG